MSRITNLITWSVVLGILFVLMPDITYGQRGGGRGGGGGGGGGYRRTAVIAGAAANGTPRDGQIGDGVRGEIGDGVIGDGNRPGYAGGIAHPGLAGAAIAIRRVPLGTVVDYLPPDCEMTFISEMEYYYCTGQYYQSMGTETEPIYVAAEPYIPQY
jgi:hypothetical protein